VDININAEKSDASLFQARDGRKKVMPHIIESSVSLDGSVLTFLCDAYAEPLFLGLPRQVLRFHRKLAPYKTSFSASASSMCVCSSVNTQRYRSIFKLLEFLIILPLLALLLIPL
jgi:glycyl-tRNA synthetase (class II)